MMPTTFMKRLRWFVMFLMMWVLIGCPLIRRLFSLTHVPVACKKPVGEKHLGDRNYTSGHGQQRHGLGHLLVLNYRQQVMGSFVSFYHLANITSFLNLNSVEPFVTSTGEMKGAPHVDKFSDLPVVRLSHFFDLDHLRGAIKSCVDGNLVTLDTFIEKASREVILVRPLVYLDKYENLFKDGTKIVEVNENGSGYLEDLNKWVKWSANEKGWNLRPFRVSRVLLIDLAIQHPFPLDELLKDFSNIINKQVAVHGSATIIIDKWRDIERKNVNESYFYQIPGFEWTHCYDFETCPFSQSVVSAAQQFRESLNETRPVVGVHIRAERLLNFDGNNSQYMKCLTELKKLINSGSISNLISNGSLYVFHDLGKYGTATYCHLPPCVHRKKQFIYAIENLGYRIVYYDPVDFRPKGLQSVFSALVEMEYLSKVDVLITVGKGQFQNKIIERFMKHKGQNHNLTRICSQDGFQAPPPPSKLDHKN